MRVSPSARLGIDRYVGPRSACAATVLLCIFTRSKCRTCQSMSGTMRTGKEAVAGVTAMTDMGTGTEIAVIGESNRGTRRTKTARRLAVAGPPRLLAVVAVERTTMARTLS